MTGRQRSGFSLIEAAIVLGRAGLVIGGIWIAAATVTERMKLNQYRDEVYDVFRKAKELIAYGMYDSETPASYAAIRLGFYPQTWIKDSSLCYDWGFAVCAGVVPPIGTGVGFRLKPDTIEMNLNFSSRSSCQKAAFTLAQNNKDGGVFSRMLVSMVADYTTFPITWSQAYTICQYNSISLRANLYGR